MFRGVKRSLVALMLLLAVCAGRAAAIEPAGYPYVKVALSPKVTKAQRAAIERRLARNPDVRTVELQTRLMQIATARRLYKSLLPPTDLAAALSKLARDTKNDILCVHTRSAAAAERLFATYNLRQTGVASISKFSGGEMLADCNLIDGVEHKRWSVLIAPADR
jgi:hypothetical protein